MKGVHTVTVRRPGQPVRHYVYAWRGGPKIMATTGGAKPALDADALELYRQALQDRGAKPAGTVAALAGEWRGSAAWKALAPGTRKTWAYILSAVETKWGILPLFAIDDRRAKRKIVQWRDTMAATPRNADLHIQVLRALLSYGQITGQLQANMAAGIPQLYQNGQRAHIIWEPEEVATWLTSESQAIRDVINLARLTGLRRTDLAGIPRTAIKRHAIVWQTSKSGRTRTVSVPILPELRQLLDDLDTRDRAKDVETILVNSFGRAWTPGGITSSFTTERARLGLPDKHLHDFRGTFVTALCLAGETDETIAGIVGWGAKEVANIRRIYVDQARTVVAMGERLANSAVKLAVKQQAD